MSETDITKIIAAALQKHGSPIAHKYPDDEFDCCAEKVLKALREAGYVTFRLPKSEPIPEEYADQSEKYHCLGRFKSFGDGHYEAWSDDLITTEHGAEYSPVVAVADGLALVAAGLTILDKIAAEAGLDEAFKSEGDQ